MRSAYEPFPRQVTGIRVMVGGSYPRALKHKPVQSLRCWPLNGVLLFEVTHCLTSLRLTAKLFIVLRQTTDLRKRATATKMRQESTITWKIPFISNWGQLNYLYSDWALGYKDLNPLHKCLFVCYFTDARTGTNARERNNEKFRDNQLNKVLRVHNHDN